MKIQPLTIKNARVWDGKGAVERDLYTSDVVLDKPHPNSITVDLSGYTIFPGLINAHDHLELNHFPRTKFRERYDNAHQWGEDISIRLNESPFRELRAYPLEDRLFIGGLKNLLCGATTVAHHNPPHKPLFRKDFPIRVLRKYGWAHSLHFSTNEEVVQSYRSTPPDVPWFIHLAEGTDDVAAGEYQRLKALGCVGKNTVIVHGVGLTDEDIADAAPKIRGLVWCPSTNHFLLGRPMTMAQLANWILVGGRFAVGSDSRLSADSDLLQEIFMTPHLEHPERNYHSHYKDEAFILNIMDDWLGFGCKADYFAIKTTVEGIAYLRRCYISLVVCGGVPQIGDPDVIAKFPYVETVEATLDGVPKAINAQLARQIARCSLREPGLELLGKPKPRMFTFN